MVRGLHKYYLSPESFMSSTFTANAGETARGIRFILSNFKDTSDLKFKNIIKINEELFENENVSFNKDDGYVDVLFPALSAGEYLSELVISDGDKKLLSGVFKIQYQESLSGVNIENLKKIIDEDFESTLKKINEVKEFLNTIQLENLATKEYVEEQIKEKSSKIEIVNNLEDGGADKALSAEQGKELFQCVSNGKKLIASAITDAGVDTEANEKFSVMATNISHIKNSLGKYYKVGDIIDSSSLAITEVVSNLSMLDNYFESDRDIKDFTLTKINNEYIIHYIDENFKLTKLLFNGYGFEKKFEVSTDLRNIKKMIVDSKGNIYISTNDKIIKLNKDGENVYIKHDTSEKGLYDFALDTDDNVYVLRKDNNIIVINESGEQSIITIKDNATAKYIAIDSQNHIYLGSYRKIYKINSSGDTTTATEGYFNIEDIKFDYADNLYVGLGNSIKIFNKNLREQFVISKPSEVDSVMKFELLQDGSQDNIYIIAQSYSPYLYGQGKFIYVYKDNKKLLELQNREFDFNKIKILDSVILVSTDEKIIQLNRDTKNQYKILE